MHKDLQKVGKHDCQAHWLAWVLLLLSTSSLPRFLCLQNDINHLCPVSSFLEEEKDESGHRLISFRAAVPGTANQILFALSLAGGALAHQRQASGSLRKPCFNQRVLAQASLQHVTATESRKGQGQLLCAQPQDLPVLVPGQEFLLT